MVFAANTSATVIGGDDAADGATDGVVHARNIISNSSGPGIFLGGAGFGGATVHGNYIGTDVSGTLSRPNVNGGIFANQANSTIIGGASAGAGNLISGHDNDGVGIVFSSGIVIQGNRIGTTADGTGALGNYRGIFLGNGTITAQIGGTAAGEANVIAFNTADAIEAFFSTTTATIRGNSIHDNGTTALHLGIDLDADGVNANDMGDADLGANGLQNYPVLTSATRSGGLSNISGTLNSTASTSFFIDFYASSAADPSGSGEGAIFIGNIGATTDSAGNVAFNFNPPAGVSPSSFITAVATNQATGSSSEFSGALASSTIFVWDGGGGDTSWINPFNWDLDSGFPGAPDSATLGIASTIDLGTTPRTVTNFTQSNGTPTGPANLTVTSSLAWARERFKVQLTGASGAGIADAEGVGTILDDDHHLIATGSGSLVRVFDATTGAMTGSFSPFGARFTGGVRVAVGDVNGDGVNDIIVGSGPGSANGARVRVFDGADPLHAPLPGVLGDFAPYGRGYRGGVYVAAGDVDSDGMAEVIVAPSAGSSGQVRVYGGADGALLSKFTAFARTGGGVRVAAGDVNGDGFADIIAGAGTGSGVRVFDALSGAALAGFTFQAFPKTHRTGVFVAGGDVNGDGLDDIIASAATASNLVRIFETGVSQSVPVQFAVGALKGVRVSTADVNGDGIADIVTGSGPGTGDAVRVTHGGTLAELFQLSGYDLKTKLGVFVG